MSWIRSMLTFWIRSLPECSVAHVCASVSECTWIRVGSFHPSAKSLPTNHSVGTSHWGAASVGERRECSTLVSPVTSLLSREYTGVAGSQFESEFQELCAEQLNVQVSELWNSNSIRKVRGVIRGCYQPHSSKSKVTDTMVCLVCQKNLTCPVPVKANWIETPCCQTLIHPECYKNTPACNACHRELGVLPCTVCWGDIGPDGTVFYEIYQNTVRKWLIHVCCGADCHPACASSLISNKCPVCRAPLKLARPNTNQLPLATQTPFAINEDEMEWWHYIDMRKEERYDVRRWKRLLYDISRPDLHQ